MENYTPNKNTEKLIKKFAKHWFVFMNWEPGILEVSKTIGNRQVKAELGEQDSYTYLEFLENGKRVGFEMQLTAFSQKIEKAFCKFLNIGGQND